MINAFEKRILWIGITCVIAVILYQVRMILPPFIYAFIISYLLSPLVTKLEKVDKSRAYSSILIISMFYVLCFVFLYRMIPSLYDSIKQILANIPANYVKIEKSEYFTFLHKYFPEQNQTILEKLKDNMDFITKNFAEHGASIVQNIIASGSNFIDMVTNFFLTPVLTFYMLRDFPKIESAVDKLITGKHQGNIRKTLKNVAEIINDYITGQIKIALIMAIFYSVCLYLSGINYGFTIGIITGLISIIPFLGVIIGFTVSSIICFIQFFSITKLLVIAAIFIVAHFIESNILAPRLVGEKLGLHPVWMIFSLAAAGILFGIKAMLIAVPVAAIISLFIKNYFKEA